MQQYGIDYIDAAVMAPVPPALENPILLGGERADQVAERLGELGMNVRVVANVIGVASAIKMCRSIMIKGLEALTTECLSTARQYHAEDEVLASLHRIWLLSSVETATIGAIASANNDQRTRDENLPRT